LHNVVLFGAGLMNSMKSVHAYPVFRRILRARSTGDILVIGVAGCVRPDLSLGKSLMSFFVCVDDIHISLRVMQIILFLHGGEHGFPACDFVN